MKEKIRNLVVLEGCDLYLGSILLMVIAALLGFKNPTIYIALFCLFLVGIGCFWFSLIWCIIHVCNSSELTGKSKAIKILLLLFFNLFYIPIYYTKYVMKKKEWYGILGCVVNIFAYIFIIVVVVALALKGEVAEKTDTYTTKDKLISVELDGEWTCPKENIGAYDLYCYETYGDENFGIFNYNRRDDIDYLLDFHLNQEIEYYIDLGYSIVNHGVDQETGFYNAVLKQEDEYALVVSAVKYNTENFTTIMTYNKENVVSEVVDFDDFGEIFNEIMISDYENDSV